jgi:hypothetical protein
LVGLLLSARYDLVWTGAIHGRADFGLGLLVYARVTVRPDRKRFLQSPPCSAGRLRIAAMTRSRA